MREEKKREGRALLLSLGVHGALFLLAALCGLFTLAQHVTEPMPVEVELVDTPGDEGGGGGSPASTPAMPEVPEVPEIVIQDKTLPPIDETYTKDPQKASQKHEAQAGTPAGRGGEGTGKGIGKGSGDGPGSGTGNGAGSGNGNGSAAPAPPPPPPPAPPRERVEASLAAEAAPTYPPELIEENVEGRVTIRINVAEDGSIESVNVISSSGYPAMDSAAIEAGWRFRFNPGDGGRKGVWTKTFRFQLE